ncbi:hypothetical protein AAMO2058_000426000 [Amorphochlora amoebiformis]
MPSSGHTEPLHCSECNAITEVPLGQENDIKCHHCGSTFDRGYEVESVVQTGGGEVSEAVESSRNIIPVPIHPTSCKFVFINWKHTIALALTLVALVLSVIGIAGATSGDLSWSKAEIQFDVTAHSMQVSHCKITFGYGLSLITASTNDECPHHMRFPKVWYSDVRHCHNVTCTSLQATGIATLVATCIAVIGLLVSVVMIVFRIKAMDSVRTIVIVALNIAFIFLLFGWMCWGVSGHRFVKGANRMRRFRHLMEDPAISNLNINVVLHHGFFATIAASVVVVFSCIIETVVGRSATLAHAVDDVAFESLSPLNQQQWQSVPAVAVRMVDMEGSDVKLPANQSQGTNESDVEVPRLQSRQSRDSRHLLALN